MFAPSIFGDSLFDDWFDFPDFDRELNREFNRMDRKLYGRHADRMMKTDVRDHDDHYEVDIDLPGFKKEDINLQLENGYLTVSATKSHEDEKNKHGKLIRQERFSGSMQRTFYVGDKLTEEDIKAKFEHGVLNLEIPKKEKVQIPEKKTIMIEG
ncbi:MAG: Hsp20/alpha crystallin family protein [Lachnospiraceae bacterium]|nr:Hsp20/alpha crystallin family protein [Lachnospiraceae bacterium]